MAPYLSGNQSYSNKDAPRSYSGIKSEEDDDMELLDLDLEAGHAVEMPQQRSKPRICWDYLIKRAQKFDWFSKVFS